MEEKKKFENSLEILFLFSKSYDHSLLMNIRCHLLLFVNDDMMKFYNTMVFVILPNKAN